MMTGVVRDPLDDVGVKGFLGSLDDGIRVPVARGSRPGGLGRLLPALRGRLPRAQIDGTVK